MARYRFAVEYLGSGFAGWQIQPGQPTVEGELERALSLCLRAPVDIVGAGRTDAGVHARGQAAHFDFDGPLEVRKVQRSVNALTPETVFIRRLEACPPDFHARYHAVSRYYKYCFALRSTALCRNQAWDCGYVLDPERFAGEIGDVMGRHNFVNFSVPREDGRRTDCNVLRADVEAGEAFLAVHIEADRFLHKMVRAIVGACFDVARGARPRGLVKAIRESAYSGEWTWAPARGLCLEKVAYRDYDY